MSSLPIEQVYHGYWVDHIHGNVLGATITVGSDTANIVVAVLSLLIGFAGSHLWDLIAFLMFMVSNTNKPVAAYRHQQRSMLRNVASPGAVALMSTKLSWYWKNIAPNSYQRLLATAMLAALCSVSFLAAGILSSLVISTSAIDVLAQSPACGVPVVDNVSSTDKWVAYWSASVQASLKFSQTCYNGSQSDPACQVYTTQAIPFNTGYAACPFREHMCLLPQDSAISMDTGLLDSEQAFGINARPKDRVKLRKRTTCAPLNGTGRLEITNMTDEIAEQYKGSPPFPEEQAILWYWGNTTSFNNYTALGSLVNSNTSHRYGALAFSYYPQSPSSVALGTINLTPELRREDADTVIIWITANSIYYYTEVDDPIFSAHRKATKFFGDTIVNQTVYKTDNPGGAWLGCTEQYQLCVSDEQCTALTGINLALNQILAMDLNPIQNATLFDFVNAFSMGPTDMVQVGAGSSQGSAPLLASETLVMDVQFGLPPNQWELEVKAWMAYILTTYQKFFGDFARGPGASGSQFDSLKTTTNNPNERRLCHSQKMKGPNGISNVSVFGLSFIVAVCGLIILANMLVTNIMKWLSRSKRIHSDGMRQWDREGMLQMQRTTFEGFGVSGWSGHCQEVPVVIKRNETFSSISTLAKVNGIGNTLQPTLSNTTTVANTGQGSVVTTPTATDSSRNPSTVTMVQIAPDKAEPRPPGRVRTT